MKTLPLSEAKAKLSELVEAVDRRDEQVLITRHGRPAAMLVSPGELDSLNATLEIVSDPEFMAEIRRGIEDFKQGRYKEYASVDELFAELEGGRASPPPARPTRGGGRASRTPPRATAKGASRARRHRG